MFGALDQELLQRHTVVGLVKKKPVCQLEPRRGVLYQCADEGFVGVSLDDHHLVGPAWSGQEFRSSFRCAQFRRNKFICRGCSVIVAARGNCLESSRDQVERCFAVTNVLPIRGFARALLRSSHLSGQWRDALYGCGPLAWSQGRCAATRDSPRVVAGTSEDS